MCFEDRFEDRLKKFTFTFICHPGKTHKCSFEARNPGNAQQVSDFMYS